MVEYSFFISSHDRVQKLPPFMYFKKQFGCEKSPSTFLGYSSYGSQLSWINLNWSNRAKIFSQSLPTILRVQFVFDTDLDPVRSSSSNFYEFARTLFVCDDKITTFEASKPLSTWFIDRCSWTINLNEYAMGFSCAFLLIHKKKSKFLSNAVYLTLCTPNIIFGPKYIRAKRRRERHTKIYTEQIRNTSWLDWTIFRLFQRRLVSQLMWYLIQT